MAGSRILLAILALSTALRASSAAPLLHEHSVPGSVSLRGVAAHEVKKGLAAHEVKKEVNIASARGAGASKKISPAVAVPVVGALPDNFAKVCSQAFTVVSVAELFDKTWFVALVYSLQFGPRAAFVGSCIGLGLHVVIAAGLGAVISNFFALWALHLATAVTFTVLAALYTYDYYSTDAEEDALESRSKEAKEDIVAYGSAEPGAAQKTSPLAAVSQVCAAIFVAEWGDRTQVAMVSLHSSLPLLPVCLGSLAAFFVLSASAVLVAQMLQGRRLSERFISGVSAASFFVFAALAYVDFAVAWRAAGSPMVRAA